jgi:hypothetical protein
MKIELVTFLARENGLTLRLVPDNEIERELLKGFVAHGKLEFADGHMRIEWSLRAESD